MNYASPAHWLGQLALVKAQVISCHDPSVKFSGNPLFKTLLSTLEVEVAAIIVSSTLELRNLILEVCDHLSTGVPISPTKGTTSRSPVIALAFFDNKIQ